MCLTLDGPVRRARSIKSEHRSTEDMRSVHSHRTAAERGAFSRLQRLSGGAVSPLSPASITVTALLLLSLPGSHSAPADLQQVTADQRQLLRQIDAVCSSYLSADLKSWASDVFGELCVLMLVQKSKEFKVQENSKRTPQFHPRRERGLSVNAELQGPGGIQSRGYFLYRPRNGRRSLEYE